MQPEGEGSQQLPAWRWQLRAALGVVVAVYIITRLWRLTDFSLDSDEVFTLQVAQMGWAESLSRVADDVVHPPLFYVLLKLWILPGGESLLWIRLLPALLAISCLAPLWLLAKDLRMRPDVALLGMALTTTCGYFLFYHQQLRMYSLLQAASLWAIWSTVRLVRDPRIFGRWFAAFLATHLVMLYSHYYGWLVFVADTVVVGVVAGYRWRQMMTAWAVLGVTYLPWVLFVYPVLLARKGLGLNIGWIPLPTVKDFAAFYVNLVGFMPIPGSGLVLLPMMLVPLGLWGWRALRQPLTIAKTEGRWFYGLLLFAFLPSMMVFVASHMLPQAVWGRRYLIIVGIPFLLLLAAATARLPHRKLRSVLAWALVVWSAVAGTAFALQDNRKFAWRDVVARVQSVDNELPATIYCLEYYTFSPLRFYSEELSAERVDVKIINNIGEIPQGRGWLTVRSVGWTDDRSPEDLLIARGCETGKTIQTSTPAVSVTLYQFECDGTLSTR